MLFQGNLHATRILQVFFIIFISTCIVMVTRMDKRIKKFRRPAKLLGRFLTFPDLKPFDLSFNSCAFITNSGHLLNKNLGSTIDSHQCVIRSNVAPTFGYEKDYGRKTTLRIVDRNSFRMILMNLNKSLTSMDEMVLNKTLIIDFNTEEQVTSVFKLGVKERPTMKLSFVSIPFMKKIYSLYKSTVGEVPSDTIWISNGFYSLAIAHHICETIDVYGMADAKYCERAKKAGPKAKKFKYHYYGPNQYECSVFERHGKAKKYTHRFLKEKEVFARWMEDFGKLKFYEPAWPETGS